MWSTLRLWAEFTLCPMVLHTYVLLPMTGQCNVKRKGLYLAELYMKHGLLADICCSSSCFPRVGVKLIYRSLRSTATFVICFHRSLLLAFSLHFSFSSAFLRSLFTQSSHLSCGLPRFLEPSCLFVSALFGSLSSFIRTIYMCLHRPKQARLI